MDRNEQEITPEEALRKLAPRNDSGDVRTVCCVMELLRSLGVGQQYRGFGMAVEAITIAVRRTDALTRVRSNILEPVSYRYGCSWKSVDRNLRTIIQCAWRMNAARLQKLAGYPLRSEPSVSEFLSMMSTHVLRRCMQQALGLGESCKISGGRLPSSCGRVMMKKTGREAQI